MNSAHSSPGLRTHRRNDLCRERQLWPYASSRHRPTGSMRRWMQSATTPFLLCPLLHFRLHRQVLWRRRASQRRTEHLDRGHPFDRRRWPTASRLVYLLFVLVVSGALIGWLAASLLKTAQATSTQSMQGLRVTRVSVLIPGFIQPDSVRLSPRVRLIAAIGRVDASGSSAESKQIFTRRFDDFRFRPVRRPYQLHADRIPAPLEHERCRTAPR